MWLDELLVIENHRVDLVVDTNQVKFRIPQSGQVRSSRIRLTDSEAGLDVDLVFFGVLHELARVCPRIVVKDVLTPYSELCAPEQQPVSSSLPSGVRKGRRRRCLHHPRYTRHPADLNSRHLGFGCAVCTRRSVDEQPPGGNEPHERDDRRGDTCRSRGRPTSTLTESTGSRLFVQVPDDAHAIAMLIRDQEKRQPNAPNDRQRLQDQRKRCHRTGELTLRTLDPG